MLPLYRGLFSPNNSRKTPIAHSLGRGMVVFREFIVWPKFYLRIPCAVCSMVSHCTAIYRESIVKGLRPVLEGFVVTMHEGRCETESHIPRALARGIWRTVRTSPSVLWQQNPNRSVLITIITWHFQFRPVNVSILHLKYDYRARSESRFACYSHCYVTWYPLMTGIVASQCPSARDAVLVTRYLTPIISACLN